MKTSENKLKKMKLQIEEHIKKAEKRMFLSELPVWKKADPKKSLYPFCITTSKKAQEKERDYKLEYLSSRCNDCHIKKTLISTFVSKLNFAYGKVCLTGTYEGFRELIREYEVLK